MVKTTVDDQILYSTSDKRHFSKDPEASLFVEKYLSTATPVQSNAEILRFASDAVNIEGMYIEAGVFMGKTVNFMAALNPSKTFHGFDSFEGLPEDWDRGDKHSLSKGAFALDNLKNLPTVLDNVLLYPGWFSDSMPVFKKEKLKDQPIAFLHIDCDLYSSTKEILRVFDENIQAGTIILCDELYNYPEYKDHEFKALNEFLEKRQISVEYMAYNENSEQVVLKVLP
jgi:hypothetical protein